ncbi:hypothetical protein [Roseobacter sp. EG26]|uniref:hypothetical protein n=1 Tax=Roseobacter sp. EG26 TaxID=3412477 RepID=UPI003CE5C258
MIAAQFASFWQYRASDQTGHTPPKPKGTPVFIGDAVQPWGCETLLLDILRRDAECAGQPSE